MKSEEVVQAWGTLTSSSSDGIATSTTVPSEKRFLTVSNGEGSPRPGRFNTMNFVKYVYVYGRGGYYRTYVNGLGDVHTSSSYGVTQQVAPPDGVLSDHPSVFYSELGDRCMEKFYEQIRGSANLAVDLAESRETLTMLKNTLQLRKNIGKFFSELVIPKDRRGRAKRQARLDYATEKWLEYRYGWQPLVFSIYDCLDTLAGKHLINRVLPVKTRSGKTYSKIVSQSSGRTVETVSVRCQQQILLRYVQRSPLIDFTSLNPLAIAWELMPLSYVADWVVNVSEVLSSWENYLIFADQFEDGYRTFSHLIVRSRTSWVNQSVPILPDPDRPGKALPNPIGYYNGYETSGFTETAKYRSRLTTLPRPANLRVRLNIGAQRQLDAAALVHQMIGKRWR